MRGSMKNNWKNKMMQFMQGRYGADQMGQMLSAVSMVFLIISLFSRNQAWFLLAVIGIVYNYFRMFSKNISKRYAENQKYLGYTQKIRSRFTGESSLPGNPSLHSAKFTIFTDALAANRKSVCPGGTAKSKSAVLNAIPDL